MAGPPLSGLKVQSTDMRLVMELEEVKEQDRVTVAPLTTLISAGASTEIQHTLLSSTDTDTSVRIGVHSTFAHTLHSNDVHTHTHFTHSVFTHSMFTHSPHTLHVHTLHVHTHAVLGVTSYKVTDYSNYITFLGNEVK